jgi:hypothetical protein
MNSGNVSRAERALKGHDFSRAADVIGKTRALAPEGRSLRNASPFRALLAALSCTLALLAAAGCRSPHVDVSVENRTGAEVKLLEVDYPSASFGADKLAPGATMHYSVALQGDGEVKVQYTSPDQKQPQMTGPALTEGQAGKLEIVLLAGGKAEFHPDLHGGK